MPEKRRKFDREFREGAVRLVNETGKSVAAAARDRSCMTLYELIPAGSAKDYDRQFIASKRSLRLALA